MKEKRLYDFCANSAKKFGGKPSDYSSVHRAIMDLCTPKSTLSGRIMVHCREFMTYGLNHLLERSTLPNADGATVSVQEIGEEHLRFIYGFVPTKKRWRNARTYENWFDGVDDCLRNYSRNREVEAPENPVVRIGLPPMRFGVTDL